MKNSLFFLSSKYFAVVFATLAVSFNLPQKALAQNEDPGLSQATEQNNAADLGSDFTVGHIGGYDITSPLGEEELSSSRERLEPNSYQVIMPHAATVRRVEAVNQAVKDTTNPADRSCNCDFGKGGGPQNTVEFETKKSCNANRNYFEDNLSEFKKNPVLKTYTETRTSETPKGSIPRKCVTYIMRTFLGSDPQQGPTDAFASCDKGQGVPRQGGYKACVTEDYVNVVYNSFVDVADCMGLPQRMMAPKFLIESGFHVNAFGALRIYDKDSGKLRDMLDIRVCQPIDKQTGAPKKISSFSELANCDKRKTDAFLKTEKAMKAQLAKGKISSEKMRAWREANEVKLRDVFDFKTAKDTWFQELSDIALADDATVCRKKFAESFCGHDLGIIGGDAGIGQFTTSAAAEAANQAAVTEKLITSSDKASCKRISAVPGVFDKPTKELEHRCDFIRSPPNPISALVKYGSLLKAIQKNISQLWDTHSADRWGGKSISDLMKIAGVANSDTPKIQEMLTVLSYNAGPSTAVILYGNWLQSRIQNLSNFKVSKEDFSFNPKPPPEFEKTDGNTVDKWKQEYSSLKKLASPNSLQKERLAKLKSLKLDHLDLSNYLRAYREGWAKGYLKYVKDAADKLDKTFGNGVCTQNNFLSL
jgi:hypothetical protein